MDYSLRMKLSGIDYMTLIFENCEQIVIKMKSVKKIDIDNIYQENDLWKIRWLDMIVDNCANGYYTTLGYDPQTTSFNRILYRHDLVAIEIHKNTGDVLQLWVEYKEDDSGFNDCENTYIDEKQQLHIEIGEKK